MLEDELLIPFKVPSIYELPSWCHDVIVGAARLNNSEKYTGKPLNTTLIIKLLMAFPTLTNANVKAYLEPRMAGSVSKQYVSQLTNAAISASANSTSKCDTRLCRLTVLFEYLDRLPESETFP
ncbi:hypothetical protein ACLKQF_23115, partial [Aeromonas salmonicida]